eukprot:CAMPEP_0198495048 /NCGR_PEP_ID=MMETSP1462-20131121/4968_1 /TAXON_ID=1333877 /ORGANISM="Brandtodinium nutriculum, Strain RCC3387" /LENGTH=54 /DNA_ID=CAMNT_0044223803 /DNA_START=69 /DNA_END=230 /DNA_ORIENTATION=-
MASAEEETKATEEAGEEKKEEKKPIVYEGAAAGKYNWDQPTSGANADKDMAGEA